MNIFKSMLTVFVMILFLGCCVVYAVDINGTDSGFIHIMPPESTLSANEMVKIENEDLSLVKDEIVLTNLLGESESDGVQGTILSVDADNAKADEEFPVDERELPDMISEEAQQGPEKAKTVDSGPPEWVPDQAKEGYEWSQSGEGGGPPPWAPEHARSEEAQQGPEKAKTVDSGPPEWVPDQAKEGYEWSQSGEGGGPPPWTPEHARERYEWSQSGQEGPPPWAGNKGKPD